MRIKIMIIGMIIAVLAVSAFAGDEEHAQKVMNAKAIDWNKLAQCLPDKVEDMKVGDIDGGTINMTDPSNPGKQISYSNAERTYTAKKGEVTLRILDTGWNQFLMMPYMMAMEMDTPDANIKNVKIAGQQAKRIQDKEKGKVTNTQYLLLVSERLMVMGEGDENTSAEQIENLIGMIDFEKLAQLAKK